MNASTPSQNPSEDGEPTSATETVKNLFKKNKTKILVGGSVLAVVIGVAISLAEGQDVTKEAKDFEDSQRFPEPLVVEVRKRQSPARHAVAPHQRTLPDGRIVNVPGHDRGVLAA